MTIRIDILRREDADSKPCWQSFDYEPRSERETVATALTRLNEGGGRIRWECGCLQKKCGACAMVIDGAPKLACDAFLRDYGKKVRLEPLRKFPVVADLIVDRSLMRENLKTLRLWFEGEARTSEKTHELAYEASRCLQCGCCLEVCPNFMAGGPFAGMAGGAPMARLLAELPEAQRAEASSLYRKRVFEGCGKSLACRNVCPAGLDIDALLVNSNAVAVWKRYFGRR